LGPVQLALADLLLKLGLKVICVAEAANPLAGWRYMPAFWGHWDRLREAFGYVQTLRRHNVPLLYNHAIIAATGVEQVESATIARLDAKGSPIPGTERTFEVDTVCLGYGFLPSYQLPVAFGCELQYDKNLCWHVPHHNSNMETTQPGVFVAGDVTDISGANVALAEGKIAGLAAAYQLGYMDEIQYNHNMAVAQAELTHFNRVAHAIQSIYAFRPGLAYLASDDTMLCRCEEVTCRKVKDAIREGAVDINQVKLFSRAGMGYCQGRMCSALVASWIFHETGQSPNELQPFTVRSPIQPILLKLLAADIIAG
jgi:NAD(P)H-nitrite reductase large subunit